MAKLTIGQKCTRFLKFLMGLRDPQVSAQLADYGFDDAAFDEGWLLLRRGVGERLDVVSTATVEQDISQLDGWENLWFPVCGAVLRRHHPEVHEQVFNNLTQTTGAEVVISVGVFLQRMEALAGGTKENKAALATLKRHGFTGEVMAEGRALLQQATSVREEPADTGADMVAEHEKAMWDYYLLWSAIARSVIADRRLLKRLGFLSNQRPSGTGTEPANDAEPADDPVDDLDMDEADDMSVLAS